jgi:hypothetical protein
MTTTTTVVVITCTPTIVAISNNNNSSHEQQQQQQFSIDEENTRSPDEQKHNLSVNIMHALQEPNNMNRIKGCSYHNKNNNRNSQDYTPTTHMMCKTQVWVIPS